MKPIGIILGIVLAPVWVLLIVPALIYHVCTEPRVK